MLPYAGRVWKSTSLFIRYSSFTSRFSLGGQETCAFLWLEVWFLFLKFLLQFPLVLNTPAPQEKKKNKSHLGHFCVVYTLFKILSRLLHFFNA